MSIETAVYVDPAEVRAHREARGFSRKQLAEATNITPGRIGGIEHKGNPTESELRRITEALLGTEEERTTGSVWNGLRKGDPVKVDGMPGKRFTFIRYREGRGDPYVSLRCGKTGAERCIEPSRIRTLRGKAVA